MVDAGQIEQLGAASSISVVHFRALLLTIAVLHRSLRTAFCHQLQALNLAGNPVCSVNAYRQIVSSFVPQLSTLDGKVLTSIDRAAISEAEVEAAIRAHSKSIDATAVMLLSPSSGSMSRLPLVNGDLSSPSQCDSTTFGSLSRSSSVKRIGVAEASTFVRWLVSSKHDHEVQNLTW